MRTKASNKQSQSHESKSFELANHPLSSTKSPGWLSWRLCETRKKLSSFTGGRMPGTLHEYASGVIPYALYVDPKAHGLAVFKMNISTQ